MLRPYLSVNETLDERGSIVRDMNAPDLVAMNAGMVDRILAGPAQPYPDGGYALRVVRTTGRRTGTQRATPLGVVRVDDLLYLVTPDRSRAWARNIDADAAVVLDPDGDARTAVPAPPEQAVPAIAAYLRAMQVPWALKAFPVGPDDGPETIAEHLDTIAVYRLDPR